MALGKSGSKQNELWVTVSELPTSPGHPFYRKLNEILEEADFDDWVEGLCARSTTRRISGDPESRLGGTSGCSSPVTSKGSSRSEESPGALATAPRSASSSGCARPMSLQSTRASPVSVSGYLRKCTTPSSSSSCGSRSRRG